MDGFASNANKQLPRYNAKWRDGTTEAVDCLHLPDNAWNIEQKLVQPTVGVARRPCGQATQFGWGCHGNRPLLAQKAWFTHLAAMAN